MNFGWGSYCNGYYPLDSLRPGGNNFDSLQQMVIGIEPPPASAQFIANNTSVCSGTGILFQDESLTPDTIKSWKWSFPGGTPATSTAQNPFITYNTPGIYDVTLIVTASKGGDTITRSHYIVVQPRNNPLPLSQTFQSGIFPPVGWYLNNPNNWTNSNLSYGSIWQLYNHAGGGGFGNSNACMLFNNYDSAINFYKINEPPPPNPLGGQRQQIYTPSYNFTNVSNDSLYFDVAYSPYNTTFSDTLAIYYSPDCGVSWTLMYLKGGDSLATAPVISVTSGDSNGFIPTPKQWRTDCIKLPSSIYGQPSVMFSFENRSGWGGQLYIDNINIPAGPSSQSVNNIVAKQSSFTLEPNPNNGIFTIQSSVVSPDSYRDQWSVEVYNVLGEKVFSQYSIPTTQYSFDLSALAEGIYLYRILNEKGEFISQGKFIIN
jgi:PKD repeat protein